MLIDLTDINLVKYITQLRYNWMLYNLTQACGTDALVAAQFSFAVCIQICDTFGFLFSLVFFPWSHQLFTCSYRYSLVLTNISDLQCIAFLHVSSLISNSIDFGTNSNFSCVILLQDIYVVQGQTTPLYSICLQTWKRHSVLLCVQNQTEYNELCVYSFVSGMLRCANIIQAIITWKIGENKTKETTATTCKSDGELESYGKPVSMNVNCFFPFTGECHPALLPQQSRNTTPSGHFLTTGTSKRYMTMLVLLETPYSKHRLKLPIET